MRCYHIAMLTDERLNENMQAMMTREERTRIEALAETEDRSLSQMLRILILEGLQRWESSQPGRRRKK